MGLFDLFNKKKFEELFEKALEEEMSKPKNANEIYDEIVNCYFMLLSLLNVNSFDSFRFPDYEDGRIVVVDGNEYDFDSEFCHNDRDATEALCTIDCLMADLEEDSFEQVLRKTEKKINTQNQKMK